MKRQIQPWCIISGLSLCYFTISPPSFAQSIIIDGTTNTFLRNCSSRCIITGTDRGGSNLFHSFSKFNVDANTRVLFQDPGVENIISRVTGTTRSHIRGTLGVRGGDANLFLINPNGIIFGPKAQLDVEGSFVASTASSLVFADGHQFSATNPEAPPLLTISVPIGLQFGATAASIQVQNSSLEVLSGKTLALVGGNVELRGGQLIAPAGQIEIGGVGANSFVSLGNDLRLGYEAVENFQDILLSQGFVINTDGDKGGAIQLQGRRIEMTESSDVAGSTSEAKKGETLRIYGSESVEMSDNSSVSTGNEIGSLGDVGDIVIKTRRLVVSDASSIRATTNGSGNGGNLTIEAGESVEINGEGRLTQLSTQTFGSGRGGTLEIKTPRLIIRDGGQISASTLSTDEGGGGTVIVNASEVEVSGTGGMGNNEFPSGLFAQSKDPGTTGNGGNLRINTEHLVIRDGATVSVAAIDGSLGQAGTLDITASSIILDNKGELRATTASGDGGDINLEDVDVLFLNRNSQISATAGTAMAPGDGGNITIDAGSIVAIPNQNSDITANAFGGRGGRITITTQNLIGIAPLTREELQMRLGTDDPAKLDPQRLPSNDITAISQTNPQLSGQVTIQTPEVDPSRGLTKLPGEPVDSTRLIAQGCSSGGTVAGSPNRFVVTGRGGLPTRPDDLLTPDIVIEDLGIRTTSTVQQPFSTTSMVNEGEKGRDGDGEILTDGLFLPVESRVKNHADTGISPAVTRPRHAIVEAQGWVVLPDGQVILTAEVPSVTPHGSWQKAASCSGS
ncbi:MAG TPA: filamentous hemagglutinin [Cyanobacteria bacterium UBA12227]|nr:filamentous hemagglutinin [Cyanobacteria bacterium UBA12227]HAX89033.1 filamentous hemagglutinin [Cyanobacteria bacterium UBA11370]HBY77622.1 filamentous hemagglutinin [Cyanobacteria bacterium UBA11148]